MVALSMCQRRIFRRFLFLPGMIITSSWCQLLGCDVLIGSAKLYQSVGETISLPSRVNNAIMTFWSMSTGQK